MSLLAWGGIFVVGGMILSWYCIRCIVELERSRKEYINKLMETIVHNKQQGEDNVE